MEQENTVEEVDELESEVEGAEVDVDEPEPEPAPESAPEPPSEPTPEPAIVDDDIVSIRGRSGVIRMKRSEYDAKYGKNKN